jgi:hypothetical protein
MDVDWGGKIFPNDSGMGILDPFVQYPVAGGFDQDDNWLDLNRVGLYVVGSVVNGRRRKMYWRRENMQIVYSLSCHLFCMSHLRVVFLHNAFDSTNSIYVSFCITRWAQP